MQFFYFLARSLKFSLNLSLALMLPLAAWSANESPQTFTLDGQLFQAGTTTPLLDSAVKIKLQIINPTATCLLYEEEQTTNTMSTDGKFTIYVGSATGAAKRTVNDPGRTMNQIFQNMSAIVANSIPGQTCAGGLYVPLAADVRYFRLIITPSASNAPNTLTPDIVLDTVPQALVAQSVQGLERTGILQVNTSGSTVLNQANLEAMFTTPAYTNLQSILAGNFIKTDTSGATLPTYAADPAGAANGDIWFDSVTNEIKYKNAAGIQTVGAAGSGISSLTVGSSMSVNGTVAGTISGSGTIDLSNTGVTAGTYTKMTVDAKGRVTAGTISLVEGDIPNLTVAGKVSGNTITSGTISGSAAINTSGNLISTGTVSGLTVQATNVRVYNGANYLEMTASTMSGNVNLTLPPTTGSAGQFLSTDGNGILSWSGITSLLAGDVSGAFGSTSVDKIKGKSVTAATVSGQMMIYDGTAWGNSVMSGDATLAHNGMLTLNKVPVAKGGTNTTTFGNNKIISSNGTGSTLQDFSCSLNQVITFDASGYAVCANVSSLSAAILNGGNTTAADISIGTNDNKALQFKTNNTVAMTISQGGNVGIGTVAPTQALHIFRDTTSGSSGDGLLIETVTANNIWYGPIIAGRNKRSSGTTDDGGILLGLSGYSVAGASGTREAASINFRSDGVPSFLNFPGRIEFSTTPTGGTSPEARLMIRQNGNIGIGITSPSTALHISGAFTAQAMSSAPSVSAVNTGRIYYDYSANKFKVSQNGGAYSDLVGTSGAIVNGGNTTGADISIGTNDNKAFSLKANNTTAMTISQSGNVGVGTATPAAKLEVAGELKVGSTAVACTAANKGSIRYNDGSSVLEFCNGASWNLVQAAACSDATPAVFSFSNEANATASTLYTSNIIQITDINCSVPVTVSGTGTPQFQICSDAGCGTVVQGWTSSPSSLTTGQYIQARLTTDAVGGAQFQATIIIGSGATVWSVTNAGGDCTASPSIGTVCADGTIYAGLSPDGNVKMFTSRCDAGQTWDGSNCTGVRAATQWNNGSSNYVATGVTSMTAGELNSTTLSGLADAGAPYQAAQYCESLSLNGHTDWYLPASSELGVLYSGQGAIRNFVTSAAGYYYSSTELASNIGIYIRMSDGVWNNNGNPKSSGCYIRCVRR